MTSHRRNWIVEIPLYHVRQETHRGVFYQELTHAKRTHLALRLRTPDPRQNKHRLFTIHSANLFQDFDPIHSWHVHIKQNDIWVFSTIQLKSIPTIVRERYVMTKPGELPVGERSEICLIIN